MNDNDFDYKVKEEVKEKFNEIPLNIDNMINDTLNGLKEKKKNRSYLKIATMLLVALFGVSTLGVTATAISSGMSIKDVVYELVGMSPEYQDYASDINITKEDMGIKYTITSAVFDGYKLSLAYTVESEDKELLNSESLYPLIDFSGLYINGEQVMCSGTGAVNPINDNKVAAVTTFDIEGGNIMRDSFWPKKIDVINTFNFEVIKLRMK